MFLRTLEGPYPSLSEEPGTPGGRGDVVGTHVEWRLRRQVTTNCLPRAVPSQKAESGQRDRGAIGHVSEQVGTCRQAGTLSSRDLVDTVAVYGLMTGNGRKEGKKGGQRVGCQPEMELAWA